MPRPLARIPVPEITAMAIFEPSGRQYLSVGIAGAPEIVFTRDQAAQLRQKIEAFERAALFEDGRPFERLHRHREAL